MHNLENSFTKVSSVHQLENLQVSKILPQFLFFFLLLVPLPVSLLLNAVWPEHKDIKCIKLCSNKYQLNLCFQNLPLFLHSELLCIYFTKRKSLFNSKKEQKLSKHFMFKLCYLNEKATLIQVILLFGKKMKIHLPGELQSQTKAVTFF